MVNFGSVTDHRKIWGNLWELSQSVQFGTFDLDMSHDIFFNGYPHIFHKFSTRSVSCLFVGETINMGVS